ncbi:MAG: tetratricopeptide repeat protein [Pseudomonadota bacterium]|nr:tetratricopeptide repeat protein [Pseudomonadota bacterium]
MSQQKIEPATNPQIDALTQAIVYAYLQRAQAFISAKDYWQALNDIEEALKIAPKSLTADYLRRFTLDFLQRNTYALTLCDEAIRSDPNNAKGHYNLGVVLSHLKRDEDALAAYDACLRIDPHYIEGHYNRGDVLGRLKRYEDALAAYDACLRIDPHYIEGHYNRGDVLGQLKRYEDALAAYDACLQIDPHYVLGHLNRGQVLRELKRYKDALAAYDACLLIDPNLAQVHLLSAELHYALRNYTLAHLNCMKVFKLDPHSEFADQCQKILKLILFPQENGVIESNFNEDALVAVGARYRSDDPITSDIDILFSAIKVESPQLNHRKRSEPNHSQTFMPPPSSVSSKKHRSDNSNPAPHF